MQEMFWNVVNAILTAAAATALWFLITNKNNDHDGPDRDR